MAGGDESRGTLRLHSVEAQAPGSQARTCASNNWKPRQSHKEDTMSKIRFAVSALVVAAFAAMTLSQTACICVNFG